MKLSVLFAIVLFVICTGASASDTPFTESENDPECVKALKKADEKAKEVPQLNEPFEYRFVGLYYEEQGFCQVYDVLALEYGLRAIVSSDSPYVSGHQILEQQLENLITNRLLVEYSANEDGTVYRLVLPDGPPE